MSTIKFIVLVLMTSTISCTMPAKKTREVTGEFEIQNFSEVSFFDESTINSEEILYKKYNLNNPDDLIVLENSVKSFVNEFERRKDNKIASDIKQYVTSSETERPYNQFDFLDDSVKESAKFIAKLLQQIRDNQNPNEAKFQIAQVARAIQLKYTPPLQTNFEILKAPVYLLRYNTAPSINFYGKAADKPELQFLQKQLIQDTDFSNVNYIDFMKFKKIPESCQYLKAKRGYGAHAGFQISCGKSDYKMKFGSSNETKLGNERYSGPFNSRVYRALGYLAPHINYFDSLKIDYNRNVITEFNERAVEYFNIRLAGIPVYQTHNKRFIDPFVFMNGVILKDGTFENAAEARKKLLPSLIQVSGNTNKNDIKTASITDDMIDQNYESQIAQYVFGPTTLTLKDDKVMGEEIGPWMPSDLNYRELKEVRGMMVLAAWTGNFDIRKDNLRLNIVKNDKKETELRLVFGDAGSGLGKSYAIGKTASEINNMFWTVSKRYQTTQKLGTGTYDTVLDLYGLKNLEPSYALSQIQLSDAQWMLGKICNFSPKQLQDLLVTSGLSSAEVLLAKSKLLERRNQMIKDFDQMNQLQKSCFVSVDRKMNYDPRKDGLISGKSDSGQTVEAPFRNQVIVNGVVKTLLEMTH